MLVIPSALQVLGGRFDAEVLLVAFGLKGLEHIKEMYLLCVQAALWQVVEVSGPAEKVETEKEEVEARGFVLGCRLLMCVFCAASCASVAAPERRPRLRGKARWRRTCVVCMAGEAEEQRNPRLEVCWKMAASPELGGVGPLLGVGGRGFSLL